jgi:hypothetical protein
MGGLVAASAGFWTDVLRWLLAVGLTAVGFAATGLLLLAGLLTTAGLLGSTALPPPAGLSRTLFFNGSSRVCGAGAGFLEA